MKVTICHKNHRDAEYLTEVNEAAGNTVYEDEFGYLYVKVLEHPNVVQAQSNSDS